MHKIVYFSILIKKVRASITFGLLNPPVSLNCTNDYIYKCIRIKIDKETRGTYLFFREMRIL